MPLNIPNLDDMTFNDLVEEAMAIVPHYAPEWTNHNASDPGITLIELLAYFTEALIYRLNRVAAPTQHNFLRLLTGAATDSTDETDQLQGAQLSAAICKAVSGLHEPQRAVTTTDYETIVRNFADTAAGEQWRHLRVRCFQQTNLEAPEWHQRSQSAPGHVSLVVVPGKHVQEDAAAELLDQIRQLLEPKLLLTTRLHVVRPPLLWLNLKVIISPKPHFKAQAVQMRVIEALHARFAPHTGDGNQDGGWPFGRDIFISDIITLLEHVPGVDQVHSAHLMNLSDKPETAADPQTAIGIQVGITATIGVDTRFGVLGAVDPDQLVRDRSGRLMAIKLRPYELVGLAPPQVEMMPTAGGEPVTGPIQ